MNSCYSCKNYHRYRESESWELDYILWYVFVCDARPTIVNLKQFPFTNTKCKSHKEDK